MRKDGSKCDTCQHAAYNHRHKVLPFAHQFEWQSVLLFWYQLLCKHQHEVEGEDGEDGLHQELHTQYLQGYYQQDAIDDNIGILNMETCGIVDDGRKTCHASCHDLIRHQEYREGDSIE